MASTSSISLQPLDGLRGGLRALLDRVELRDRVDRRLATVRGEAVGPL